ncbi:MAG: alpha/beta hydrolase [Acidimicrobiales bacterium]
METSTVSPYFAETANGLTQLRRRWSVEQPKAAILLVHGIGEHSGRYEFVGETLARQGYDVLAFDNRGFGQTGGARAYVDAFSDYLDDVEALVAERRELGVPVVLFGHSLGGLIVATYLTSHRPAVDLGVLSSPALTAVVPAWQRIAAPAVGRGRPTLFIPAAIDGEILSRDVAVQEAYVNDPLVVKGATAGLGQAIFSTMADTSARLHTLRLPIYVLHGADDRLVPPAASEPLDRLPNVTRRLWAGLRHECLNEPEKAQVLGELVDWLDSQLARELN